MTFRSICCLLCAIPLSLFAQPNTSSRRQLIQNVRVFDGSVVLEHRSVLIENGKVARIYSHPVHLSSTELINGTGHTLLPGFIDAHVHLPDQAERAAHQALQLGVTTQLDMFSGGDRLKKIKQLEFEDRPDLSDLRTAGVGATVPGGHPTQMGGPPIPTIASPDQAQQFVDARIAEGSDYVKIIHDDGSTWTWTNKRVPMLDNPTMRALVEAAHKRGKLAVVHVLSEQQARDAIEAGADGLAHIFSGDTVGADFGRFAAVHHVFVIPTLSTIYLDCGKSEGPAILSDPHLGPYITPEWRQSLEMAKPDPSKNHYCNGTDEAIHQLVKDHVPLLVGTDAPILGTTYGASVHGELALLVRDGMTPTQALAAATSVPAHKFRLADRGEIKAGMRADLVLVRGDPTRNIVDTRNIVAVWKRGVRVQR
jgi:imidazolonepropionase-like amidohydrolase